MGFSISTKIWLASSNDTISEFIFFILLNARLKSVAVPKGGYDFLAIVSICFNSFAFGIFPFNFSGNL